MRASSEGSDEPARKFAAAPSSSRPELGTARYAHDYAVRPRPAHGYPPILNSIRRAVCLLYNSEKDLVNHGFVAQSQTNIIELEKHLLDLSAVSQATQGVFYMLTVGTGGRQLTRFFESGSFTGFFHQKRNSDVLPRFITECGYRVYTEQDIKQRSLRKVALKNNQPAKQPSKRRNRPGQAYSRELAHIKDHIEVVKRIAAEVPDDLPLRLFAHIVRKNANVDKPDHRARENTSRVPGCQIREANKSRAAAQILRPPNRVSSVRLPPLLPMLYHQFIGISGRFVGLGKTHRQIPLRGQIINQNIRYVHTIGFEPQEQASLEHALQHFRVDGSSRYPTLQTLADAPLPLPLQDQMDVLCSLSNDPFQLYPTTNGPLSQASSRVGYIRYLSYQPPLDDYSAPNMLPASFRNRYVYFRSNDRDSESIALLQHVFAGGSDISAPVTSSSDGGLQHDVHQLPQDFPPPPPMMRKVSQPVVKITAEILRRQRVPCAPNMSLLQIRPYHNFRTKLVEVGSVLWRLHSDNEECFLMNAYVEGGELCTNSFVEVTHRHTDGLTTCTCETYRVISGIAWNQRQGGDVLPVGILCMHCRFFKEEMLPRLPSLLTSNHSAPSDNGSSLELKLKKAGTYLNNPVVRLTTGPGTSKFSVRSQTGTSCATVNVSATGIMATCTKGTCQAAQRHKRSVNGLLKLDAASSLCEHLATMQANRELWAPEVPPEAEEEDEDVQGSHDTAQEFDTPLCQNSTPSPKCFDTGTGKWDFGGYSVHKPVEEHNLDKTRNVQARNAVHDGSLSYPRDRQTGCFSGLDLIPKIPESNTCVCGSPYKNEQHPNGLPPIEDFTCTLYMRHAPVQCKVYHLRCLAAGEKCSQPLKYSGLEHSLFLWSRHVAAGDEIGWDFINRVLTSKVSFSAFCADMTRVYKSINFLSAPFMHKSTFVSWFFAWCAHMDIDFRAEIDPWCGHNPKYIAGDGTHVGISFRRLSISPVERADRDFAKVPSHKRFDRVFLPYTEGIDDGWVRKARKHLKMTAKAYLSRGTLDQTTKATEDQNLLEACCQDDRCKDFLRYFLNGDMPANLKQASAELFLLLASDAAVITLLPPRYHADILAGTNTILQGGQLELNFCTFCPELGRAMEEAVADHSEQQFAGFVLYLLDFVQGVHLPDEAAAPAEQIPGSYNPESGVAYYFTQHGNIVRQLPTYQINSSGKNHDDEPSLEERCTKRYGRVSLGGWTYLFLWFCPLHGHCYGFHIVQGAEGRKDPFASMYRYMEEPPKEVFYDFACSLSEYCLNREPGFFSNTRMWHDVFHGVTHLCGKNFKSQRVSFPDFNTEICEQFNSFVQCIKYTGTHLSQSHFTFFIQFMIYVWNKRKTSTFMRKVDLALAGHE